MNPAVWRTSGRPMVVYCNLGSWLAGALALFLAWHSSHCRCMSSCGRPPRFVLVTQRVVRPTER
jgi:hypothetical protein